MRRYYISLLVITSLSVNNIFAQATLPDFTLKNTNNKITVLWLNQYPKQVNGISVQRSYDSTKNFTSIASVFNPQNTVNGYTDINPPYDKMYYRLFIGFDTGVYILTESKRPEVNSSIDYTQLIIEINALYEKNIQLYKEKVEAQRIAAQLLAARNPTKKQSNNTKPKTNITEGDEEDFNTGPATFPSRRIFTNKDNNVVVKLANAKTNKYSITFFTEDYRSLFTINNVTDDYFTIEKVNFSSAGWYSFEIFRNDQLYEENKIYIAKDEKK